MLMEDGWRDEVEAESLADAWHYSVDLALFHFTASIPLLQFLVVSKILSEE